MRDILQQLVVNNNISIVKLNPVNDWIGVDLDMVLKPLVAAGALQFAYGPTATAQVRTCVHLLHVMFEAVSIPQATLVRVFDTCSSMPAVTEGFPAF
ncbi:MAG: hypothetical protein HC767_09210 [Akkermansiaceae bacterium]|nr:hypothetical protein [Akkermansiaceae bacterium]